MRTDSTTIAGVTLNVIASALFALLFAYTALLPAMEGGEIYGWRILLTFPCLSLFILWRGYGAQITTLGRRLIAERYFWATRLASAFLLGAQLWLFMWAPGNGHGLAVSLGYFMMPITMVVIGRIAFGDRLTGFQKVACLLAVAGIVNQLAISQTLAWPTLAVCVGYPAYFWLRRKTDTNHIGGLWLDMLLSLPACLWFILAGGHMTEAINIEAIGLVTGLGLLSALALGFQALSAPLLNLSLFGLLVYVEPVLLLGVSLLLGEVIDPREWPTYIAIWLAVVVLMVEGAWGLHNRRYAPEKTAPVAE